VTANAIGDYALLSDCATAALVGRDGAIDWWCVPRFDGPSVFGRMLDPDAGQWLLRPVNAYDVERRYVDGSMVLETDMRTADGAVRVVDALALPATEGHELGHVRHGALVRHVRGLEGAVELVTEIAPRFEYGLRAPRVSRIDERIAFTDVQGIRTLDLTFDADMHVDGDRATARLTVRAGQTIGFVLGDPASGAHDIASAELVRSTVAAWQSWSKLHKRYDGAHREVVETSSRVLQALTYARAGSLIAAPTTSLPEVVGGEANWDYRYAWLRDASLVLQALWVGACPDEADAYFGWMARAIDGREPQILYAVNGDPEVDEFVLDHLAGYRGSRPVRIGNDAWRQRQLDVPGEVLDAAWRLRDQLSFDEPTADMIAALADRTVRGWQEKDSGIWEGREGERDYVSSKVMCWVALDRAVKLAGAIGRDATEWTAARDEIRDAVLSEGWNEGLGAFAGAFGSDHLDASVLLIPLVEFLPADDPRVTATIAAIERELTHDGHVRRWTGADDEGTFVMCSCWLAECHARAGRVDRANEIFERVVAYANDVGLLAEMIDPVRGELLGNFPQGLSHAALVNAAWAIDRAQKKET
jgi:GH15 family glucan-1,4-alpha-glucosidase